MSIVQKAADKFAKSIKDITLCICSLTKLPSSSII